MITVTMEITLKPGMLAEFREAAALAFAGTSSRPGFRSIRAVPSLDDENKVLFIEEWDRAEDYRAYKAWRADGNPAVGLGECMAGRPALQLWGEAIA